MGTLIDLNALDRTLADRVAATGVPGVAFAIVRHGALLFSGGYGVTSTGEDRRPVTERTLFQIGSTTKPLTGSMIMRLVERGLLDLDRPVISWLPDLRLSIPGAAEQVTLQMLLSHTAGLPWDQITPTRMYGRRDPEALAGWVRDELPERSMVGPPGEQWTYSNPGINLAAHVAEVATGRHYPELMRAEVFEPLGMSRTTFDPTVAMTWPIAQAHEPVEGESPAVIHRAADNAAQYPAAFAWSTVLDLANFAIAQLSGGRFASEQFLFRASIELMHAPNASHGPDGQGSYGLTFQIDDWRGYKRVWHPGGINGFACEFDLLPELGVAVVALCNMAGSSGVRDIVEELLTAVADCGG